MPAAARALLFALCALAALAHLQAASDQCSMTSTTATNKFSLTVDPANYKESTNYTVTVKGVSETDIFTVLQLQAVDRSKNTNFGDWTTENETHLCPDHNLLYNTSSKSVTAHWRSPNTAAECVEIRAYITESDGLKLITYNLTTASSTTESPKVTEPTKHPANDATHHTDATSKPPSKNEGTATTKLTHSTTGGSESGAYSSCILIAIVQSVYLLFIGGRQ